MEKNKAGKQIETIVEIALSHRMVERVQRDNEFECRPEGGKRASHMVSE